MSSANFSPLPSFLPQGDALQWHPALVSVHTIADALICGAYLSMACSLLYLGRKQAGAGRVLPAILTLFAAFLLSSGLAHATEIVTMWRPEYGVSGIAKTGSAFIAIATAITLVRAAPALLLWPQRAR